jgi:hypothetical protein
MINEVYWIIEEFVLVRQIYKDGATHLDDILAYYLGKASRLISRSEHRKFLKNCGLIIQFINYSDLANRQLIGLGLRIISESKITLQAFDASSEGRIQKAMFLLSRGLLKSRFHRIEFENIEIVI